jgi:hypothetical protein
MDGRTRTLERAYLTAVALLVDVLVWLALEPE